MKAIALILALVSIGTAAGQLCDTETICTSEDGSETFEYAVGSECTEHSGCCYRPARGDDDAEATCFTFIDDSKPATGTPQNIGVTLEETLRRLREKKQERDEEKSKKETEERSLGFGPPPPSCAEPEPFPYNCDFTGHVRYVEQPPLEIPYCVRIPCSLDPFKQSMYDLDKAACGIQPGCYFDDAVYEYRIGFKQSILPGVPVCHLAIRSDVFAREADKVAELYGVYNPFFTECLLDNFMDEMNEGPSGCGLLPMLEIFHIPAKMAGWKSIVPDDCGLIGACWVRGRGCFYAVDLSNVLVKSGQRFFFNHHEIVHGRPKCQDFDSSSPYKILQSYHKCLIAGCSVDTDIIALYYNYLFDIGKDMSPEDHWKYWEEAESGRIGPHNLDDIYWPRSSTKPGPPKPTSGSTFSRPVLPPRPGMPPMPPSSTFRRPAPPTRGRVQCGLPFKGRGYRPCEPKKIPSPFPQKHCPYKPVHFHKYPALTGSFEGCCDINPCYLSRRNIRKIHSGPSYYYSEWSQWSKCSKTCGPDGVQMRTRKCVSNDKSKCDEILVKTKSCAKPCAHWGPWTQSEPCPSRYPGYCAITLRERVCIPPRGKCRGNRQDSQQCFPQYCS